MTNAIFGLAGVLLGGLLTGWISVYRDNSHRVDAARDALIARLDLLVATVGEVDDAVQSWVAFGVLHRRVVGTGGAAEDRFLEEAGRSAGRIATKCIPLRVLAEDVASGRDLASMSRSYEEGARATALEKPGRGGPADVAYPLLRDTLVETLGAEMARVRQTQPPWRDRARGRFTPTVLDHRQ